MGSTPAYRKSIRLQSWDYRRSAFYFVTICTKERQHYFGKIRDGKMGLSVQGCAAWYFWNQIPNHFDNVALDAFVVMPNHVHGIIQITPNENGFDPVASRHGVMLLRDHVMPQEKIREFGQPKSGSLSVILNHYKGALTRWCNRNDYELGWQSRFYDHIVRNEESLNLIREYIECNPLNWEEDFGNVF